MALDDTIEVGAQASVTPEEGYHATESYANAFCFEVKINGISESNINQAFTRVSGIVSQSEMMEFMRSLDWSGAWCVPGVVCVCVTVSRLKLPRRDANPTR